MTAGADEPAGERDPHVIHFPSGLPGFEACRRFVLLASGGGSPIQRLDSVSGPPASFLVIDRRLLPVPTWTALCEADRARLGAAEGTPLLWLALVMIEPDGTLRANLRAPVVINPAGMAGCQVAIPDASVPATHVLLNGDASTRPRRGGAARTVAASGRTRQALPKPSASSLRRPAMVGERGRPAGRRLVGGARAGRHPASR
jgi:flagellar assembly factor FliW